MSKQADCVIIGGGIVGLSIAYFLSKKGMNKIELLERSYIGSGSTTRNASNIASWHEVRTLDNIRIEKAAFKAYENLSSELKFNILHERQSHYCLAFNDDHIKLLENVIQAHQKIGLDSRFVDVKRIKRKMPYLNLENVKAISNFASGAKIHHDAVVRGFTNALRRNGVQLHEHTPALGIETKNGKVNTVLTDGGRIETPLVINAAGAWSSRIAKWVGISMPVVSRKREMLVTESLSHFTDDLVTSLDSDVYFNQTVRGEVLIGGTEEGPIVSDFNQLTTLPFLKRCTKAIVKLVPSLSHATLMRSWAGLRDRTPDGNPLVGMERDVGGFFQANAFFGYGLTWAPVIGIAVAESIVGVKSLGISLENFLPSRFQPGAA